MPTNSSDGDAPEQLSGSDVDGSVRIEPSSIPKLVGTLQESLDSVGVQIEQAITELRVRPWAGDPVSDNAAEEFNRRSTGDDEGALPALYDYRDQLQAAAESLNQAQAQYQRIDGDNAVDLGGVSE